jgi:membrane-associated protease RseP (regulator of RpoE activity)
VKNPLLAIFFSAAAAFAAATWVYRPPQTGHVPAESSFDASLPAADRIAALEQAVSEERQARQLLQEEVMILTAELDSLYVIQEAPPAPGDATEASPDPGGSATIADRRREFQRRNSPEWRMDRLIEAGFLPAEAEWILEREQELQMEALQARYEAGRTGDPADFYRDRFSTSSQLREELGDAGYERYLEANGRSTNVEISSVIGSSPAQSAGLQPGDEIVRYDGERVFSMTDINLASMEGEPGQSVVIDFTRDGVLMQVVMPRGPLGVTGGRRRN